MKTPIVRVPPSPTGLLHIGTVRTVLFNFLFAKKHGGKILFRMEDTDKERSEKKYEENITNGLSALGFSFDGEIVHQSERTEIYRKYLMQLLFEGKAYKCFCTKEKTDAQRAEQMKNKLPPRHQCDCADDQEKDEDHVIRFKVGADRDIIFQDLVRKNVKINTKEISDFVIAKSLDQPLYNFCVVVDDHEMKISHVIRGEDHISNTPKQIMVFEAFGWEIPTFAHLPLILNQDKSKLSKRKNKVSIDDFLKEGYTKEALLNFLALLGWNTADEKEVFTMDELIEQFDFDGVNKSGAIFDEKKLMWINGVWLRNKSVEEFKQLIIPFLDGIDYLKHGEAFFEKVLVSIQERIKKLSEASTLLGFYFAEKLEYDKELFLHQKMKVDSEKSLAALKKGRKALVSLGEWNTEETEKVLIDLIAKLGWKNGQLLWPLRVALTGEKFSPGVFELLDVFGRNESLERIDRGIEILTK